MIGELCTARQPFALWGKHLVKLASHTLRAALNGVRDQGAQREEAIDHLVEGDGALGISRRPQLVEIGDGMVEHFQQCLFSGAELRFAHGVKRSQHPFHEHFGQEVQRQLGCNHRVPSWPGVKTGEQSTLQCLFQRCKPVAAEAGRHGHADLAMFRTRERDEPVRCRRAQCKVTNEPQVLIHRSAHQDLSDQRWLCD